MTARNPQSANSQSAGSHSAVYDVGYGKPPRHTQFRKGRSGNPGGRPRRSEVERMKALVLHEAYRMLLIRDDAGVVWPMPALQAILRKQVKLAADGNIQAQRAFLATVRTVEQEEADTASFAAICGEEYRLPGVDDEDEMDDDDETDDDDEMDDDGETEDGEELDREDWDGDDMKGEDSGGGEAEDGETDAADVEDRRDASPEMAGAAPAAAPVPRPSPPVAPPSFDEQRQAVPPETVRASPPFTPPLGAFAKGPVGGSKDAAARPVADGAACRPRKRRRRASVEPCSTPGASRAPARRRRRDAAAPGIRTPQIP
jgi:hypothetical protein